MRSLYSPPGRCETALKSSSHSSISMPSSHDCLNSTISSPEIQLPRVERRIVGSDARPAFFVADTLGAAGQQFIERNIEYLREYYQIVHRRLRVVALPLLHLLARNGALLRDIVAGQPRLLSEIIYAVSECHSINFCFFLIISNRADLFNLPQVVFLRTRGLYIKILSGLNSPDSNSK